MQYVVRKSSIQRPDAPRFGSVAARLILPGTVIEASDLPAPDVERLLAVGILEPVAPTRPAEPAPGSVGKWIRDPASLAGRSLAELRAAAFEIDEAMDAEATRSMSEAELVRLLSADFAPTRAPAAEQPASDRARPPQSRLDAARRKAQG